MSRLNIDTTTMAVAARALEDFADQYPDRITVWVETEENQMDIKIGSISKNRNEGPMRHHIYFHKTSALMEA